MRIQLSSLKSGIPSVLLPPPPSISSLVNCYKEGPMLIYRLDKNVINPSRMQDVRLMEQDINP
jgi:hypothetical protein